jgi:hypothetical protein
MIFPVCEVDIALCEERCDSLLGGNVSEEISEHETTNYFFQKK